MSPESPVEWYSYAVVRVAPRVEREEFVNVGVVLFARASDTLRARIRLDPGRVLTLDPQADLNLIASHLRAFESICRGSPDAGPLGELPLSERFHWLTAPRSTVIQVSPVHEGRSADLESTLEELFERYVGVVGSEG